MSDALPTIRPTEPTGLRARLRGGMRKGWKFFLLCAASTWFTVLMLAVLLIAVGWEAYGWLDWQFLTSFDSSRPANAGIFAALWGSGWLLLLTGLVSVPIGVGAAVYLEEFAADNWLTRLIRVNLANLAGVPSIVYGILGLTVFVRMFDLFGSGGAIELEELNLLGMRIPLPFGRSVFSGALTLSLLILPVIIVASQEALRAVPPSLRHASLALGATRWQTVSRQVLPSAVPGILTGIILALSRAIGETAPLVMIGAFTYVNFTPGNIGTLKDIRENPQGLLEAPFDMFTAMPLQIYNWIGDNKEEFHDLAAAGIVVLLGVLLVMNGTAIYIRHRHQKKWAQH